MPDKLLHAAPLPRSSQTGSSGDLARRVSSSGIVSDTGTGAVEAISTEPGTQTVDGVYRGMGSEMLAKQIAELADAGAVEYVPFTGLAESTPDDGYYVVESGDARPETPKTDKLHRYSLTLRKVGTRATHRRAVRVRPQDVTNPWGSRSDELVAISGRAREQQWWHPATGAIEPATPTTTRTVEGRPDGTPLEADVYDLTDASFYDPADGGPDVPVLVYDVALDEEFWTDVTVWDTRDVQKTAETQVSGAVVGTQTVGASASTIGGTTYDVASQWQRVYRADHDFDGSVVLDSGALRLTIDDGTGALTAERARGPYDDWATESLRASTWGVRDVDVRRVGLARAAAVVTFVDSSDGDVAAVELELSRGDHRALLTTPENASGTPAGLVDKLTPIAATTERAAAATADVVARTDLR